MTRAALITLVCATGALAEPLALDEAEALLAAGLYRDAAASAELALAQAPGLPAALKVRARANRALAMNPPAERAMATLDPEYDYARLEQRLGAVAADLAACLGAATGVERAQLQVELDAARVLVQRAGARRAEADVVRTRRAEQAAEEVPRVRAGAAASRVAALAAAHAQWEEDWAFQRGMRKAGVTLLVMALALGAVSVGTFLGSNGEVDSIRRGGLMSGAEIQARASTAGALRTVSLVTLISGALSAIVGAVVLVPSGYPDAPGGAAP